MTTEFDNERSQDLGATEHPRQDTSGDTAVPDSGPQEVPIDLIPPAEQFEGVEMVGPDVIAQLRPLFASVENYLTSLWHDPRYGIRVMVNLMRYLQEEEMTLERARQIQVEDVQPVASL